MGNEVPVNGGSGAPDSRKSSLVDRFGRTVSYLRIAVTDRCNLRCRYCIPDENVRFLAPDSLLSFDELEKLVTVFVSLGVHKVRITGGEPVLRTGLPEFIRRLRENSGIGTLHLTSNGVETWKYIPDLQKAGLSGINFSLDTLDRDRFFHFTRRDRLSDVLRSIKTAVASGIPVKINCVIQAGKNFDELQQIADLARELPVQVRFIEQMSFNGKSGALKMPVSRKMIRGRLKELYPDLRPDERISGTAELYRVSGFSGKIGIISGHSRTFCSSCDRLRITPEGMMKNCLYDNGVLDLRRMLRSGAGPDQLEAAVREAVMHKHENGLHAEKELSEYRSMAAIGG